MLSISCARLISNYSATDDFQFNALAFLQGFTTTALNNIKVYGYLFTAVLFDKKTAEPIRIADEADL